MEIQDGLLPQAVNFLAKFANLALLLTVIGLHDIMGAEESGVEGTILITPAQGGPQRLGLPDSAPLRNAKFTVTSHGEEINEFQTDDAGDFQLLLPPGHYAISRKDGKRGLTGCGPFEIEVAAGQMQKVKWICDSGLR